MKILRVVAYMLLALIFCTADSCHNPPKTPVLDHILFYGNTIKSNTSQSYPVFFHGDPNNLEFSQLTQYAEVTAQVADRSYGLGAGGEKLGSGINGGVEFVPDGLYMKLTVYWPFHLLETNPQSVTLRIREHSPDSYYAGTPQEYSDPLIITLTVPIPKAVSATYSTNPFRVDITWDRSGCPDGSAFSIYRVPPSAIPSSGYVDSSVVRTLQIVAPTGMSGYTEGLSRGSIDPGTYQYYVEADLGQWRSDLAGPAPCSIIFPYFVTYNQDGATSGSVPVDSTPYYPGNPVTVKGNTGQLMQDKYNFIGWNTDEGYGGTHYRTYGTFNMGTHDVTLYAEWDENPMVVTLTPDWKGSKTTNSYTGPGFLPSDVDKASITTVQNTGTADISNISFTGDDGSKWSDTFLKAGQPASVPIPVSTSGQWTCNSLVSTSGSSDNPDIQISVYWQEVPPQ